MADSDICPTGYTQSLRPGVKASFGLALDTQRLNEASPSGPAHKVSSAALLTQSNYLSIALHRLVLPSSSKGENVVVEAMGMLCFYFRTNNTIKPGT